MKHSLFLLFACVFMIFSACKTDNTSTHLPQKKEVEQLPIPTKQKVVTVNNTDNVNVQIQESEHVKVSSEQTNKESDFQDINETAATPEELVQKAINTKPTAKVENKPVVKTTKEKPVKKPKPNPVKSAPIEYLPKIKFDELSHDFGEITEGDIVKHNFTFTNVGKTKLSIEKATASCGCTKPSFPFIDILPGETGYIGVTYHSVNKDGPQKPTITVFSNAHPSEMTLYLSGIVKAKSEEEELEEQESMPQDTTKN